VRFEWDPEKAQKNLDLHRVSFDEAAVCSEIPWPSRSMIQIIRKTRRDS